VIAQVVRCFENPDIIHVSNRVDPDSDMETVNIELALADLETLSKRRERAERTLKVQAAPEKKAAEAILAVLERLQSVLGEGKPVRTAGLTEDEQNMVRDCHFITLKPQIYICNTDEAGVKSAAAGKPDARIQAVFRRAAAEGSEAVVICGKFEAELAGIGDIEEKKAFLEEIGLREPGLAALVRACYRLLGLVTFFTAGRDECRAWTIRAGDSAQRAAGVIHSDFEKGFIKAEVYGFNDIMEYGSEARIKEAGKYRIEGRGYTVRDGDVMFFRSNL
jgi:GTP-binding protein YchF